MEIKVIKVARLLDVCRAVAVAAILIQLGMQWARVGSRASILDQPSTITDNPRLGLGSAERTLIMITASTCHFCRESLPFYRTMVTRARRAGARIVAVTAEDPDVNRTYLETAGVPVDAVVSASQADIPIRGTPTLILVTRNGSVMKSWVGKLSGSHEAMLMGMLEREWPATAR